MTLSAFVPLREHYGPGPHPHSGTPQVVHAGGRVGRRARAWAAMAKRRPGGVAAAYQRGATEAAIGRRREWGAGRAPEFRGVDTRDLHAERRRIGFESSFAGARGESSRGNDGLQGRLTKELQARGYHGGGLEQRGSGYNKLPRLKGKATRYERGVAEEVRRRKLAEIDVDLRARDGDASIGGVDRETLKGIRKMLADETRAAWWFKHSNTSTDNLVDLVYRRESLGYKRETGNLARFVGR